MKAYIKLIKRLKSLLLIIQIFAGGCTTIIKLNTAKEYTLTNKVDDFSDKICPLNRSTSLEIIGNNTHALDAFREIQKKFTPQLKNPAELAILMILIQMNFRPDMSSPSADTQFVIGTDSDPAYLSFRATSEDKKAYPLVEAMNWIKANYPAGRKLTFYAQFLNRNLESKIFVGKELARELASNTGKISSIDDPVRDAFFKADQILLERESLPKLNFNSLVNLESDKGSIAQTRHLFSYKSASDENVGIKCNFDLNLYDHSIFPITRQERRPNVFGFRLGKFVFMAMSSQTTDWSKLIKKNLLAFQRSAGTSPSGICLMEKEGHGMILFSSHSRDPGQHLYQAIKTGIFDSRDVSEIKTYMTFPRHLFLLNPPRLLLESERSSKEQLENFLKMDIPIYHKNDMGKIWVYRSSKGRTGPAFILDPRHESKVKCL